MMHQKSLTQIAKSVAHIWVRDAVAILRYGGKPKPLSTYTRGDILEIMDILQDRPDLPKLELGSEWESLRDRAVEDARILIWAKTK